MVYFRSTFSSNVPHHILVYGMFLQINTTSCMHSLLDVDLVCLFLQINTEGT